MGRLLLVLAAEALMAAIMGAMTAPALAAPPDTVPNSGASHNCVATSQGVLFSREYGGEHLGQLVRGLAPHGGQGEWVQGALQNTC